MKMQLRAGAAKVNITPPVGIPLSGYTARKDVSQGVHDELYAKSLILDNGKRILAIITTGLLGFYGDFVDKIRGLIKERTNIDKDNILISATHTHSAPDTLRGLYSQGKASDSWMDILAQKIAGCAYVAWKNRREAQIGVGKGMVGGIGVNRRNPDGKPIDQEVGVIRVDDARGNLMTVLINYTCHAVVLGPDNLLISADYPGYTMRMIERIKGETVVAMFTNGAEGDINTGHSADISGIGGHIPGRTFERAEKLGNILGGEVLKVLEQIKVSPKIHLGVKRELVKLPLKNLPSLREAEKELEGKTSIIDKLKGTSLEKLTKAKIEKFYAEITLSLVKEVESLGLGRTMRIEIQVMRLNDAVLVAVPGELFVEIGLDIKRKSGFENTFIVGLANGEVGYVPTRQAFMEGGYESTSTKFTEETGERIRDTALKLIKRTGERKLWNLQEGGKGGLCLNKREVVLATLRHEEPGIVPGQINFFSINGLRKFVPVFSEDWRENTLKRLEFLDNSFVEVGSAKLHQSKFLRETDELERVTFFRSVSGSGVLRTKLIEETEEDLTFEFETGGRWRVHKDPFWRDYIHYPIQNMEDLEKMKIPDPKDPKRYEGAKENIEYFKEKGYFTSAEINGFFSGVWYRYQNMQDFMVNMVINEEFAKKVVDMVGKFNLETARNFLERGVDSILFCDDLGSNTGMLISPDLYRKFFYPWHKKLVEICHNYDAYLNMHSHGNINEIMSLLVEAGVDILNPVGPSDNMDLGELKEKYGHKITFMGGVSKFIGRMNRKELEMHLREVVETGRPEEGFILMSEGGIPDDMSREDFKFYLEINKKYRRRE